MKKIINSLLLLFLLILANCTTQNGQNNEANPNQDTENEPTMLQCEKSGGFWNECGSPCAGTGAEICIQVCRAQCECGGEQEFKCPEGYRCRLGGKIKDEIGVCVKG